MQYLFSLDFKVRDYECDLQGVVNNANYQHYFEHTRHEFLLSLGEDFAALHDAGIDTYVYRITINFKKSLRSGDSFTSSLNCHQKGAKLIFEQYIFLPDGTLSASAEVEAVAVKNGVVTRGEVFETLLAKMAK